MATSKRALQWYYSCLKQGKCGDDFRYSDEVFKIAVDSRSSAVRNIGALYFAYVRGQNDIAEKAFRKSLTRRTIVSWTNYLSFLNYIGKKELACKKFEQFKVLLDTNTFRDVLVYLPQVNRIRAQLQNCSELF